MARKAGAFHWGSALLGAAATLLLILLVAAGLIFSGSSNVAASSGHISAVRWLFETAMEASVTSRADRLEPPQQLSEQGLTQGAVHFKAMCQQCHGGPGAERAEFARGLLPQPPELSRAAQEWNRSELFWIVKHGIKMTAMPAFGRDHSDEEIWNIVGFLERLPQMSAQEYEAIGPADPQAAHDSAQGADGHAGHSH